jgi:putative endonuclease
MFYVYIIYSKHLGLYYVGQTDDLKRRITEHKTGRSTFTSRSDDWELIYFEAFTSRKLALNRERKLKPRARAFQELLKRIIDKSGEG